MPSSARLPGVVFCEPCRQAKKNIEELEEHKLHVYTRKTLAGKVHVSMYVKNSRWICLCACGFEHHCSIIVIGFSYCHASLSVYILRVLGCLVICNGNSHLNLVNSSNTSLRLYSLFWEGNPNTYPSTLLDVLS